MNSDKKVVRFFTFVILGLFLISLIGGVIAPTSYTVQDEIEVNADLDGNGAIGSISTYSTSSPSSASPASDDLARGMEEPGWKTRLVNWFKLDSTHDDNFFGGDTGFSMFSDNDQKMIAKILMAILVMLLVYSITDSMPFIGDKNKEGVRWAFSAVVAILSFMFVSMNAITALLTTYEAMGIALTSIIPLLILASFSWKLYDNHKAIGMVIVRPLFIIFALYMSGKFIFNLELGYRWMYLLAAAGSAIWAFWSADIFKKIKEEKKEERKENIKDNVGDFANAVDATNEGMAKLDHK